MWSLIACPRLGHPVPQWAVARGSACRWGMPPARSRCVCQRDSQLMRPSWLVLADGLRTGRVSTTCLKFLHFSSWEQPPFKHQSLSRLKPFSKRTGTWDVQELDLTLFLCVIGWGRKSNPRCSEPFYFGDVSRSSRKIPFLLKSSK